MKLGLSIWNGFMEWSYGSFLAVFIVTGEHEPTLVAARVRSSISDTIFYIRGFFIIPHYGSEPYATTLYWSLFAQLGSG